VTLPKPIADRYEIRPGDEIAWIASGDITRVIPHAKCRETEDPESRLRLFDQATERIRRQTKAGRRKQAQERGWKREDLYTRGRSH
jgi:bifunctional DNA-binding transcriptional regulator/antitoxin component of YhaV-PrlF toxin-antitoxin module